MSNPIELHFYNKNNEIIKTYSQDRITWNFFKKAMTVKETTELSEKNVDIICNFVIEFFGKKFNKRKLLKYTDVEQLLAVAGQIAMRVIGIMKENGIDLPEE